MTNANTTEEQKWQLQYDSLVTYSRDFIARGESGKWLHAASNTLMRTGNVTDDTIQKFPGQLATLLELYGTQDSTSTTLISMAGMMVEHEANQNSISAVLFDYASKISDPNSANEIRQSVPYLIAGLEYNMDITPPVAPLAAFMTLRYGRIEDYSWPILERLITKNEPLKRDVADLALSLVNKQVSIGEPHCNHDDLGLDKFSRVLDFGTSDNQKGAMLAFGHILAHNPINSYEIKENFVFVEEMRTKGWLTDETIATGLHQKLREITSLEPDQLSKYQRDQHFNTGNGTLAYLSTIQPDALQVHTPYVLRSFDLRTGYNGCFSLFDYLDAMKDGKLRQNSSSPHSGQPFFLAHRSDTDISAMRQSASQLFTDIALHPDTPDYYVSDWLGKAIKLNPDNQTAVASLDQAIKTDPYDSAAPLVVKLMESGFMTQEVGRDMLCNKGRDALYDAFIENQKRNAQERQQRLDSLKAFM